MNGTKFTVQLNKYLKMPFDATHCAFIEWHLFVRAELRVVRSGERPHHCARSTQTLTFYNLLITRIRINCNGNLA